MENSGRYSVMSASNERNCLLSRSISVIRAVKILVMEPILKPELTSGVPRLGSVHVMCIKLISCGLNGQKKKKDNK